MFVVFSVLGCIIVGIILLSLTTTEENDDHYKLTFCGWTVVDMQFPPPSKTTISHQDLMQQLSHQIHQTTNAVGRKRILKVNIGGENIDIGLTLSMLTFFRHGCDCVQCGAKGTLVKLTYHTGNPSKELRYQGVDTIQYPKLTLYATNAQGEEMVMTADHIIPKSKGGSPWNVKPGARLRQVGRCLQQSHGCSH